MKTVLKKELSLKHCSLHHEEPFVFIKSQWQRESKPSVIYLIYRWLIAIFFLSIFVTSVVDRDHLNSSFSRRVKWLIFMTNWGLTICTFQALFVAILLSICMGASCKNKPSLQNKALKCYKVYWVFNLIATDIALNVTIVYWAILYNGTRVKAMNYFVHGNNSVLMLIDLFVVAHPTRLIHCYYTVIFTIGYTLFSLIYYLLGGTGIDGKPYIYHTMDWGNKSGLTVALCFGELCFLAVVHGVVWGFYKFRVWIHSKVAKTRTDEVTEEDL